MLIRSKLGIVFNSSASILSGHCSQINYPMPYSVLQLGSKYLQYQLSAANGKGHGIHSPFVFDMVTKVFNDKQHYVAYQTIEAVRSALKKESRVISIDDFGAGSSKSATNERSVGSIAQNALKPPKFGQLFYRLVKNYQPHTILELGTSLGITTSYLAAAAAPDATIITMEGASNIAAIARENFEQLHPSRIQIVEGNFDETLQPVLDRLPALDLAYIDGNHRKEPTLRYFNQMKPKLHEHSMLIFDDVHWSPEMEEAWAAIQQDTMVTCSIDLFFIGLVFFRKEFKVPQQFTIRF